MKVSTIVNGVSLEEVGSTRFLGMQISGVLTWLIHVSELCSRISAGIFAR